jgi:hypothetical protein
MPFMTKLTVDRMCTIELATALDLAGHSFPYLHGFRAPGSKVIWEDATAGRGKLIRIQRRGGRTARYVADDTLFEVVSPFSEIVFTEPPA